MYNKEGLEEITRLHPDSFPAQALLSNFRHFEGLHRTLSGRWIHACASYLCDGQSYAYEPRFLRKQEELYKCAMTATHALQLGVHVGHSLLLMLIANPRLQITAIDGHAALAEPTVRYLNLHFSGRIRLVLGDAVEALGLLPDGAFDLVHIDSDPRDAEVGVQFHESLRLVKPSAIYVFNDYDASRAPVEGLLKSGLLELKVLPESPWRNCVTEVTDKASTESILRSASPYSCRSRARLIMNIHAVKFANRHRIHGAVVEIGDVTGGSMIAMMRADASRRRSFFLYDTFPKESASESSSTLSSEVAKNVTAHNGGVAEARIHFNHGRDATESVFPEDIAVLRLDTAFYDTSKFTLEHFYDLVSPGGLIILDDYGPWTGHKAALDNFFIAHPHLSLKPIDYTGAFFQKPGIDICYVTGLFLDSQASKPLEQTLEHFHKLASSQIRVGLYLHPRLQSLGEQLEGMYANVRVLEYLDVDASFLAGSHIQATLPEQRCLDTDTEEYLCARLMKLKLLSLAAEDPRISERALAWVDFEIFHLFDDVAECQRLMEELKLHRTDRILSPGPVPQVEGDLCTQILGKYYGCFMLGKKSLFVEAERQQSKLVAEHLPKLTWDVNYWTRMTCFQWYHAAHNASMLRDAPNSPFVFDHEAP